MKLKLFIISIITLTTLQAHCSYIDPSFECDGSSNVPAISQEDARQLFSNLSLSTVPGIPEAVDAFLENGNGTPFRLNGATLYGVINHDHANIAVSLVWKGKDAVAKKILKASAPTFEDVQDILRNLSYDNSYSAFGQFLVDNYDAKPSQIKLISFDKESTKIVANLKLLKE